MGVASLATRDKYNGILR